MVVWFSASSVYCCTSVIHSQVGGGCRAAVPPAGILYARMILHILAQIHAGEEAKLMHNVSLAKDDLEEAP